MVFLINGTNKINLGFLLNSFTFRACNYKQLRKKKNRAFLGNFSILTITTLLHLRIFLEQGFKMKLNVWCTGIYKTPTRGEISKKYLEKIYVMLLMKLQKRTCRFFFLNTVLDKVIG